MVILIIGGLQPATVSAAKYLSFGGTEAVVIVMDEPTYPYRR